MNSSFESARQILSFLHILMQNDVKPILRPLQTSWSGLEHFLLAAAASTSAGALQLCGEGEAGICLAGANGDVYFLVVSAYGLSMCSGQGELRAGGPAIR